MSGSESETDCREIFVREIFVREIFVFRNGSEMQTQIIEGGDNNQC
jgi:hypothetical protein